MTDTVATDAPDEAPDPDEPVVEPDPAREEVVAGIRRALGDDVIESVVARGDVWVRVDRSAWRRAGQAARDVLGFDYFCFLSAIDWRASAELSSRYEQVWTPPEDAATPSEELLTAPRVAGGESRFQLLARLYSLDRKVGLTLKADLDDERPEAESWVPIFRGADWHEREAWEMFGIEFLGHPGLRHIYLPGEFEGFPLRKDFPLLARVVKPWPGLVDKEPIPGEDEEEEDGGDAATPPDGAEASTEGTD